MNQPTPQERQRIVVLARQIISSEIGVLEGCVRIADITGVIRGESPDADLFVFASIADDCDHLPLLEEVRKHWASDALKEKDKEIFAISQNVKSKVFEASRRVIERLSGRD